MNPTAGERFGPYEILGSLGRGGVGEVYRAWDGRLEREVALKLLHDEYPQHGNRERFLIEARAASALSHPNICTVFDMGEKDGWPYLVMELLRGETLKQRIERGGLPAEEIAQHGTEIAEALSAAHSLGIVHRDIKPANVMLLRQPDGRSRAKVLDFGLAKLTGPLPGRLAHHDEHLTVVGEAVGTVSYMSPEQARGEELDGRSDLFSLGVVLYEMATRRTPFHGTTTALLFVQLLNHDPEPIRDWNDAVPRALEKVIFRLLEKDPARRYQTASEAAAALAGLAVKPSSSRWRRASTPAVPLVRVEEPVARAALPARPDFRREAGVIRLGLGQSAPAREAPAVTSTPIEHPAPRRPSGRPFSPPLSEPQRPPILSAQPPEERPAAPPFLWSDTRRASAPRRATRATPMPARSTATPVFSALQDAIPGASRPADEPATRTPPLYESQDDSQHESNAGQPMTPTHERRHSFHSSTVRKTSWAGGDFLRVPIAAASDEYAERSRLRLRRLRRIRLGVAALAACALVTFAAFRFNRRPIAAVPLGDTLLVTTVENHTGVELLDGSIAQGLEFALAELPGVNLRGTADYRAALESLGSPHAPASFALAQQAAHASVARAFLYGEVREAEETTHGSGAGYILSITLTETATGRELGRAEATAERTEQIPGAIDELTTRLRPLLGVSSSSGTGVVAAAENLRAGIPLAAEATGSLRALHAYALAGNALSEGRRDAALHDLGLAASADPNFVQALVAASWLARDARAGEASIKFATQAEAVAGSRSSHTALLAELAYRANARGDLEGAASAARRLLEFNPNDRAAQLDLARILRAQGRFEEALAQAQHALATSPQDPALIRETELALLALDRYPAALALEASAAAYTSADPGLTRLAHYLAGRPERVASAASLTSSASATASQHTAEAILLDNTGQLTEAAAAWQDAINAQRSESSLAGAAPAMLAAASLNRALAGRCASALPYARAAADALSSEAQRSTSAAFDAAIAGALCGDTSLASNLPASSLDPARAPELHAAVALAQGDPRSTLQELEPVQASDPTYLAPYLRGIAHIAAEEPAAAAADFQQVLAHRGAALLGGTDVYPMAQLGLARAAAQLSDRDGGMQAYRQFLKLWSGSASADTLDRLRAEATLGARGTFPRATPASVVLASATLTSAPARAVAEPRSAIQPAVPRRRPADPFVDYAAPPVRSSRSQSYPEERKYPQSIHENDLE